MIRLFIGLYLISFSATAYEGFLCVPSIRESRIQVLVVKDDIQVLVNNPSGYDFMPQFDGPSSIFNISFNKMQGEDLKELGDSFSFQWPKTACQLDVEQFTVSCRSEAANLVKSIRSFGITTTEVTEKYDGEIYQKLKFRLSLEKDNLYFVSLQFNKKSCQKFN